MTPQSSSPWLDQKLQSSLANRRVQLQRAQGLIVQGHLVRVVGSTLEASGIQAPVGSRCLVENSDGTDLEAEVVGFSGQTLYLMPLPTTHNLAPGARVRAIPHTATAAVGRELLGRVIDARGEPLDGYPLPPMKTRVPLSGKAINPLERPAIRQPLDVGVRAINGLLSIGRGQRMGLFASAGVGKSMLLGMMTRFTEADVIVVGLIGERGREVKEFIEDVLGEVALEKTVIVAAPADVSAVLRLRGASLATSIAEYFRDQGNQVLLLMDSLTRYGQAQREIALAIGEPPASKGYPPSVFSRINQLVERAGNTTLGSITAIYTVLTEGEDQIDPVADAAQAILDGHLVLSRELAEAGHYPAIDLGASISRVVSQVCSPEHQGVIRRFKQLYSTYQQQADLIRVGAYQAGSDPLLDDAVAFYPHLMGYLQQDHQAGVDHDTALSELATLFAPAEPAAESASASA